MANVYYRINDTSPTRSSSVVLDRPLTNEEIDGNFKALDDDISLKADAASGVLTDPTISDIIVTSGYLDDVTIGGSTRGPGSFTTVVGTTGTFSSAVSASSFSGVGSNLTSLTSTNISGIIPASNLGTGTPTSSTVLLGNGTWATIPVSAEDGMITVQGANGLTGSASFTTNQAGNETITISHSDTSSQSSVNNSGRVYIQDITLDDYGHITAIASATETYTYTHPTYTYTAPVDDNETTLTTIDLISELTVSNGHVTGGTKRNLVAGSNVSITADTAGDITIASSYTNTTYSAGSGITLSGTEFSHTDTSSQASVNNSGATVIQDISLDTYGHVTAIGNATLTYATLGLSSSQLRPTTVSASAPSGGTSGDVWLQY